MGFIIREAAENDLDALLELYSHLNTPVPELDDKINSLWQRLLADPNHHILLGVSDGKPVSTCVAVIIENLTRGQRPYMLIENVVTHPDFRGKGYASVLLEQSKNIAKTAGCYKIMLLTGSKLDSTLDFYRKAGFNSEDKTAFIQWI